MNSDYSQQKHDLRVIYTARTESEINEAAGKGFFPLVKRVIPSPEIRSKFAVFQDPESGKIQVGGDYRFLPKGNVVIDYEFYYPHSFPSPFAAYFLIPPDIRVDEIVVLDDLIEDIVGARWNQSDVYRLQSSKAKWDGENFIIDEPLATIFIG